MLNICVDLLTGAAISYQVIKDSLTVALNLQGALIGCASGLFINVWLNVGALSLKWRHPILPPLPTYGCTDRINGSWKDWMYNDTTSFDEPSVNVSYTTHVPDQQVIIML